MGKTTFTGPIRAGSILNTSGTTLGQNVKNVGSVVMVQSWPLTQAGTATALATPIVLPANSHILNIQMISTVTWTGAATNLSFGTSATATETYHIIDRSLQCWSGLHIFYCILFSIALFGYFLVFLLISFFYNESRPYHTDAFSRLDTNFETHITLYKILITIVGHFLYSQKLHWLIITIHILGALNFCKQYLQYLPYYNSRTSVLFGAGWFIYIWLALNILLLKALETVTY